MKRQIVLWLLAIVSIVGFAQNTTEHLKFMGIPINGTITQFQSKLLAKGCTLDREMSRYLPVGQRSFKGQFIGNKADIVAFYDEKNKIVYRAKVIISGFSEDMADQVYTKIKNLLFQKYGTDWSFESTKEGKEAISWLITSPNVPFQEDLSDYSPESMSSAGFIGDIGLFITKDNDYSNYPYWFNVHVDYQDAINKEKHNNQNLEDL